MYPGWVVAVQLLAQMRLIDVLGEQALVYDDTGHHHEERLPASAEAEEHDLHVSVTEEIVSHDDAQLEAYLEGNEPSVNELARTL